VQGDAPTSPRGRPRKVPVHVPELHGSTIEVTNDDRTGSCPHVDRHGLLQPEHMHDNAEAPEMQIGPAEEEFFDSQEEDFYYDDYNDNDEEEREVWEDGGEVHLQVPPEFRHAPDRRGKKQLHMQRLPCQRTDADVCASAALLFASTPPNPFTSLQDYFVHKTGTSTIEGEAAECDEHAHARVEYYEGVENNHDVGNCIYERRDCSAGVCEREPNGVRFQTRIKSLLGGKGGDAGQPGASRSQLGGAEGEGAQPGTASA
jgi:hypothetical protein